MKIYDKQIGIKKGTWFDNSKITFVAALKGTILEGKFMHITF